MNNNFESIREEVKNLYASSADECMRVWFYEGHVAVVARYAEEIAGKVGADVEICVLGALFHDIARAWEVNDDPDLMNESLSRVDEIMKKYEYSDKEIEKVKQVILPHSCRETSPETEEGKVLATADSLAHLLSDFYFILPFYGWLTAAKDFDGYKQWLLGKIERDLHKKIFYPEYRDLARPKYEALKIVFGAS